MPFALNIAVLGSIHGGKRTLLSSLLGHDVCTKCCENTGVKRCTIVPGLQSGDKENSSAPVYSVEETAQNTLDLGEDVTINETQYNVGTKEPIVPMLSHASSTFVIVPSMEEPGSEEYISKQWDKWDTIIVVLDGGKGFTDDDSKLLKRIKKLYDADKKQILILCNKIDDVESERLSKHVKKASSKVKKIFGEDGDINEPSSNLCFLPISAAQAFIYRAGSRTTLDKFKGFDKDLVSLVGKDYFGSKNWKKLTDDEKFQKTHETISESKNFESGIDDCGFKVCV